MLFLLSIIKGWSTVSIDFKNAFAQATLPKPIFLDLPPGYVWRQGQQGHEHEEELVR